MKKGILTAAKLIIVLLLLWGTSLLFKDVFMSDKSNMTLTNESIDFDVKKYAKYNNLNDEEKVIYNNLYSHSLNILEGKENTTQLSINNFAVDYKNISLDKTINAFKMDYPYLFWYSDGATINGEFYSNLVNIKIELNDYYRENKNDPYILNSILLKKAINSYEYAKIIANTEYEDINDKLNYYKDYILLNVEYDETAKENKLSGNLDLDSFMSGNFINVFDNDETTNVVCTGYSEALLLLCDLGGVNNCYYVTGTTSNEHAWNYVINNGEKYLIDLTNIEKGMLGYKNRLYLVEIPMDNKEYSLSLNGTTITYAEN